jgi:phage gpG-like protein
MIDLRFNVMGQEQLSRTFNILQLGISNLKPALENIAKDFYTTQKGVFQSEGGYEGNPKWAKLSKEYKKWKDREHSGAKILELTGSLRKAATTKNAKGSVFNLEKNSLAMGVDLPVGGWNLAAIHQFGTKRMPAREVIRLTNMEKNRWVRIFKDYIDTVIKKGK